ncbi:MAG TPA: hypothetical protein VF470_09865 [Sphingomicrobium sp.]
MLGIDGGRTPESPPKGVFVRVEAAADPRSAIQRLRFETGQSPTTVAGPEGSTLTTWPNGYRMYEWPVSDAGHFHKINCGKFDEKPVVDRPINLCRAYVGYSAKTMVFVIFDESDWPVSKSEELYKVTRKFLSTIKSSQ